MRKGLTFILLLLSMSFMLQAQTVIFSDDFESGTASDAWELFWEGEEMIQAVDMTTAPEILPDGGAFAGYLQDIDGSYTGAAMAVSGEMSSQNYMVEADVFCHTNNPGGSAYTGVVAYADSSVNYYVKLVADFDGDNRFRLYNNNLDFETFQYTFHHAIDATGLYDGDGWHKMALEVETLENENVSYNVYFDGVHIGGPFIDDSEGHTTSGQYGVFAFQQGAAGIPGYFDNVVVTEPAPPPTYLFQDDFETGFPADEWFTFWEDEELVEVYNADQAPILLDTGGDYVGFLQDGDGSYTGAAMSVAGNLYDQNYMVEADVFCYTNHAGGSAYTGLVAYADSAANYYVKLVADFDGDNRFRLYNNVFDMETFQYSFHHAIDATGLYEGDGWHKMGLAVETLEDGTAAYTAYFDGEIIGGPFIDDAEDHTTSGYYGIFSFQQGATGLPGYFDNFAVMGEPMEVVPGDLNGDLTVDILDIVTMVAIILGDTEPDALQLAAGDINNDGVIDILDIVSVVAIILGPSRSIHNDINSAQVDVHNNQIIINTDGDLAGVQMDVSGNFTIMSSPQGWQVQNNAETLLAYRMDDSFSDSELVLNYSGNLTVGRSLVADWNGNGVYTRTVKHTTEPTLAVTSANPFNPVVVIDYSIAIDANVTISVFNLQGRLVDTLVDGFQSAGYHQAIWHSATKASGVYFLRMQAGSDVITQNIMLLK
ncbi:MAG: T9SS type A sorting domain-containing protein [FCB group bacterium]|nr:T9SS type A sorting domain-containing protein [FCB group bacterium]